MIARSVTWVFGLPPPRAGYRGHAAAQEGEEGARRDREGAGRATWGEGVDVYIASADTLRAKAIFSVRGVLAPSLPIDRVC